LGALPVLPDAAIVCVAGVYARERPGLSGRELRDLAHTDAALDSGPSCPDDADCDGLLDVNDPCPDRSNRLVADYFAKGSDLWSSFSGAWTFDGEGARGTVVDGSGLAGDGPCPRSTCVPEYLVDVVAELESETTPAFGVAASMGWGNPPSGYFYCEIRPVVGATAMRLNVEPGGTPAVEAMQDLDGPIAIRLMVLGDRQWCRTHRPGDASPTANYSARPAGSVGLYLFDGTVRFDSMRMYDLPAACDGPLFAPPPAP